MAIIQGQYKNTNIETLLKGLDKVFTKHTTNLINHCINDVYNLKTAKGYGLDMWGKLLGFPRYLPTKEAPENIKPENNALSFNEKTFYKVQFGYVDLDAFTYLRLADDMYKVMLNCVLLKTTTDCSLESINAYCKHLFTQMGGSAFIRDSEDMEFTYFIFRFKMPDWFKYIIDNYDILPRAAGVGMKYFESEAYYIGFKGQEPKDKRVYTNFYRARFAPSPYIPKRELFKDYKLLQSVTLYTTQKLYYLSKEQRYNLDNELIAYKTNLINNFKYSQNVIYSNDTTYTLSHEQRYNLDTSYKADLINKFEYPKTTIYSHDFSYILAHEQIPNKTELFTNFKYLQGIKLYTNEVAYILSKEQRYNVDSSEKSNLIKQFKYLQNVALYSNETTYFIKPLEAETTPPPTEPPTETDPTAMMIDFTEVMNKKQQETLTDADREPLSFDYAITLLYQNSFNVATADNNITFTYTRPADTKIAEAQKHYTDNKKPELLLDTLKQYAFAAYNILAQHIIFYPYLKGYDTKHNELLQSLIEPLNPPRVDESGTTYTHRFKDSVINMSNLEFSNSIADKWILELKGLIKRDSGQESKPTPPTPQNYIPTESDLKKFKDDVAYRVEADLTGFRNQFGYTDSYQFVEYANMNLSWFGLYNIKNELQTIADKYPDDLDRFINECGIYISEVELQNIKAETFKTKAEFDSYCKNTIDTFREYS